MNEKLKGAGAFSKESNSGQLTVSAGLALLVTLFTPVEEAQKPYLQMALTPVFAFLLPARVPWKNGGPR